MASTLFRQEAVEHQRTRLWGEVIVAQPLSTQLLTLLLLVILAATGCYLYWGTYSRKQTVTGYLLPDKGVVNINANRGGTVEQVLVKEGSHVNAGQPLIKVRVLNAMDNGRNADALLVAALERQQTSLKQTIQSEQKRRTNQTEKLKTTAKGLKRSIHALHRSLSVARKQLKLARQSYRDLSNLNSAHYISKNRYRKAQTHLLQAQQQVDELQQKLVDKHNRLDQNRYQFQSVVINTEQKIEQVQSQISGIDRQLIKQQVQGEYSVEAPTSGTVSTLQAVVGQTANPHQPLVSIIPAGGHLQAQLYVPSRAIGFVRTGLPVEMRYNAFPYQRFGSHRGKIVQVAKSILAPKEVPAPIQLKQPVYRVTAQLDHSYIQAYGKRLPLTAGMLLKADIVLDRRPLYQWLFKPLLSLKGTL